ncbi:MULTISPECIES: LysR family transcriptional regulator [Paenarthrobacter]|uniref:LysR family transcriptional regulator n=1 Tax=Paenarthrobacter ureafaciens TaxID=37931 RepID=A0AAX3ELS1_PAEUR|nr:MULTISPECIES: LysR family transcriptional regulator [Paenarthrobacter]MDO5863019.1 LysR family transcriptional regulator [Paenarthrobacter sp. SD-2]MDO5874088.1 LysR family transcriptional regulator [Paenarthrobacter sp. SD-1]MEC3854163.1 LysR family transcriptional regulator [Paenarthrobacter ureafaciens]UYV93520.1 LysR family transcriptional regulator [Paenarthrobacter ureafaciens]UYV98049.1 LysR family transcriptional regulator [Paenarthrobacter ureafaciens]
MLVITPIDMDHGWVELQQFRYVVAVAEDGNFTRAAARCFVVQSALSHQIKRLEDELGVKLFNRTSRRVELTAAGTAFLAAARTALNAAERAAVDAAAAAGHITGRLRVGVIPTVTAINVSASLQEFREAHPQIHVMLQAGGSDELEASITRGDLDVGFLGLPENRKPKGVSWRHLGSDPLVAVTSQEHRLANSREVKLCDLAQETFADFPGGTPARDESDHAFAAANIHREVAFESMATDLTVDLIRHNLAVALLPAGYVPRHPDLVSIPIADGPSRSEYVAWSRFNPSPATHAFLELINPSDLPENNHGQP